jgi:hypothetical protein
MMMTRRRRQTYFFETFNPFVDLGIRSLSRSEIVAFLVLLREARPPHGVARVSFGVIAACGGISRRQAVRAVKALIHREVVQIVRRGGRGVGPTTYCVVPGGIEMFGLTRRNGEAESEAIDVEE